MYVILVTKTTGVGKYENLTSEEIISAIARHGVIKENGGKLVTYLMKNAHWSPLDMINFTFEIETSRDIGRQLLRHASIKPQEHSTRYSDRVEFEPIEIRMEHETNRQSSTDIFNPVIKVNWDTEYDYEVPASDLIHAHLESSERLYKKLIEAKVAKECARAILPGCLRTTMSMNGTLRSWLAFLNVRMDHHAQKEARMIAELIGEELEKDMPAVFSALEWRNGYFM